MSIDLYTFETEFEDFSSQEKYMDALVSHSPDHFEFFEIELQGIWVVRSQPAHIRKLLVPIPETIVVGYLLTAQLPTPL